MACTKHKALRLLATLGIGAAATACDGAPEGLRPADATDDPAAFQPSGLPDGALTPGFIPDYCVPVEEEEEPRVRKAGGGGGAGAPPAPIGAPVLQPNQGPDTADDCPTPSAALPGQPATQVPVDRECFFGDDTNAVQATIERTLETVGNVDYLHVRLTFNPHFVDNSYGDNAVGWADSKKGKHTFKDLVGSDHAELIIEDGRGDVALHLKADYLSEDPRQPSGYGTLGVSGGKNDGEVFVGNAAHVAEVATSLDRNLNGCGYSAYTEDSPATDTSYTPNPAAPRWDFRMVYELWIDTAAFGGSGPGDVFVEFVHASPSKTGSSTVEVEPGPCPPDTPEDPDDPTTPGNPDPPDDPPDDPADPPDDADPPFEWPPPWWPFPPPDDNDDPPEEPEPPPTVPEEPEQPEPPVVPEEPEPPEEPEEPPLTPETPEPPYEEPPCPPGTVHEDDLPGPII